MGSRQRIVYLDGQALARPRDGVGSYTVNVLKEALRRGPSDVTYRAILFRDQLTTPKLIEPSTHFEYIYLPFPRRLYALLFRFVRVPVNIWLPSKPTVVWYPNFVTFPWVAHAERVVTIHDFTYRHFPEMVSARNLTYLRRFVPYSIKHAARILTVSHAVASEIQTIFPSSPRIAVVSPPVTLSKQATKPKLAASFPKQYILAVSTLEPRKNVDGLLDAYLGLPKSIRSNYPLIAAGRMGWLSDTTKQRFLQAVENEEVIWCNGPSDIELSYLFRHATAFVFMSHYEGYGMPLAEAKLLRLPIVALDTPINRETAGDHAHYAKTPSEATKLLSQSLGTHHARPIQNASSTQLDVTSFMESLGIQ